MVLDGRDPARLAEAVDALPSPRFVTAVPGDVTDPAHRARLIEAAQAAGGLDLLVNNASTLGQLPLPPLAEYRLDDAADVFAANVVAPLALAQAALPLLTERGAAHRQRLLRRRRRGLPGLGRLRGLEGGARPS